VANSTCFPTDRLDDEVIRRIWNETPYWIFCWASGLAMAQWLLAEPHHVKDKVVLDFGAGSVWLQLLQKWQVQNV
jgi:predicted nicotinamide N-methyase